jgi:formate hydrogenlyase subunit 6/NADH:ubiquinone oxidoreductase subunit I
MGKGYWHTIFHTLSGLWKGMTITFRHLLQVNKRHSKEGIQSEHYFDQPEGLMTVQYPHESLPVPDNGRYRLHNEIDDCIVCDKCAKICPVDCIEIEAIKAPEVFGMTSDGTPKRIHAARFDIDMAKCCFCGLCTTVCPTECLTMTKAFDFSEYDVADHIYSFANMLEENKQQVQKEEASSGSSSSMAEVKPENNHD